MPAGPTRFASLRVANFRWYLTGQCISVAGGWMENVAVGWLVLQLTGSGTQLGTVVAVRFAPLLLIGPWGGLIVDRHAKLPMLTITSSVHAAIAVTLGAMTIGHAVTVWWLLALSGAAGLVDVFDAPARQAFIADLVGTDLLGNAIALNSIVINVSRIVGPAGAGLLIAGSGIGPCFLLNAATFLAFIVTLRLMRRDRLRPSRTEVRGAGQVRAGLRYVRRDRRLRVPLVLVAISGAFAWEYQVTLPLFTARSFAGTAETYGTALAFLGAGSIVGGFVIAGKRRFTERTVPLVAIGWGLAIVVTAVAPALWMALWLLTIVGFGTVAFNSLSKTVLQALSTDVMRGRVMALWSLGWQGSTVVGGPVVGYVGQTFGGRYALGLGGLATVVAGALELILSRGYTRRALPANTIASSSAGSELASR